MQLTWLEDFVELARTRSFSRAAENRFVTHPAFGRRIHALEQWVGAELVARTQPVSLTPAGLLFLDAASHTIDVLHAVRAQLQDTVQNSGETLRIATGRTLARTFFPGWYETINQRFGPFPVSVSTGGAQEVILRLASGDVDLLVIYSSPSTRLLIDPQRYESVTLAREMLLPVCAADAKGRPKFRLPATNPATPIPWLGFSQSLTLRGVLAKHLAGLPQKLSLHMVYQADSYESILEMAKRGAGLAWLPQSLVQEDLKQGNLLLVGDADMRVGFDISLYRMRGNSNALVKAIWDGVSSDAIDDN
ncbi:bacterial regulatory helix-turn-helix, lysR family protein [Collimonas arenae]|uniref:Bacterial regulatory helix-turn-helix, lysR family protein n=1 Tax=Collimonas arenae TaxID=279058 RepID=A0A127PP11_9BURK|nr:LysR family transcriptional regulator [Collimonas arenae]AMO99508.1 bacterial regulatory helix-turn-helix, lysR family protein [Collimonas arenae]AMP09407.1 bacterial regulatory helix-turn-helix, lysR family protein [Collimonas arenae]